MLFTKLSLVAALAAAVAAQDVDQGDIPQQCTSVCAQVVSIARDCDNKHNDDAAELQCMCSAQNASTLFPTCEACVAQFDRDDDNDNDNDDINDRNDNDVRDILTRCNFSTTTFNSAAPAPTGSIRPTQATVVTSGTVVVTATPSLNSNPNQAASASAPAQLTNAASAPTAAAAIGLGALGLALGMI